jgi:hypothetical protein
MISLSATEINLTLIVDGDRLAPAMRAVHDAFFGAGAADVQDATPAAEVRA